MRNLKRALSLALAAAMLIGMMVVGASAAEYKDADSIKNTEAVDVLTGLGVIGGSDGNYNPQKTLTRAEFCVMIANALTGGKFDKTLFEGTNTPFTDIKGHWGAAYIAYCYSAGVIAGTGDGTTFSPDKTLTAAQAEAILLSALGYNKAGEFGLNGQFELNVTSWAQKAGLTDGLSVSATAGISRDNTAKLIFNALTVSTPVEYNAAFAMYNTVGNGIGGVVDGNTNYALTLAAKNFDLGRTSKTTPTAVTYGTTSTSTVATYRMQIGAGLYVTVDANQIGREGYVWYRQNDDNKYEAVSDVIYTDTVLATVANGKGMENWSAKGNANFVAELDFTYNGAADNYIVNGHNGVDFSDATHGNINTLDNQTGVVFTFVDTNSNGKADLVYVADRTVYTVTGAPTTKTSGGKTIVNVPGVTGLAFSNNKETKDVIGYEGLVKDDVVLVYTEGQTSKIIIEKAEKVTGTLTAINGGKYTVAGAAYEASGMATTPLTAISGTTYLNKDVDLWLDASGYVVKSAPVTKAALPYALVVNYDDKTIGGQQTKLLTADGQFIVGTAEYTVGGTAYEMTTDTDDGTHKIVAKRQTVVTYELKDGIYKLYPVAGASATDEGTVTAATTITKGTASVGSGVVANASTVFVRIDAQDKVTTYTGIGNVATVTSATSTTAIGKGASGNQIASLIFVNGGTVTTTAANDIIYVFNTTPTVTKDGTTTLYTYAVVKNGVITTETFSSNVQDGAVSNTHEIDNLGAFKVTARDAKGYATAVDDASGDYAYTATLDTGDLVKSLADNTLVYGASSSILVDGKTVVVNVNKVTGALTEGTLADIQATTTVGADASKVNVIAAVKDGSATGTAAYVFIMGTGTYPAMAAPATVTLAGADSNGATVTGTTDVKAGTAAVTSWTSSNKYIKVNATNETGYTIDSVKIGDTDATSSYELTTTTAHTLTVKVTVSHDGTGVTQVYEYTIAIPAQS